MSLRAQQSDWSSSATAAWTRGWQSRSPGKSRRAERHLSWTRPRSMPERTLRKISSTSLQRAHELVVLMTPWALERPYVWLEIGAAWLRGIPIVVVLLGLTVAQFHERANVPVALRERNLISLNRFDRYI